MLKKVLATLAVAATLTLAAVPLAAQQTKTIVYGRSNVQFSSSFQGVLAQLGTGITDLRGASLSTGSNTFVVKQGVIDLATGLTEVETSGGYLITVSGHVFSFQSLTFDTTSPTSPVVTALFSVDNTLIGRMPLFLVQVPADFTLPVQQQDGIVQQLSSLPLTLAPQAANGINAVFGVQAISGGINVGTADVYAVLSGSNNVD